MASKAIETKRRSLTDDLRAVLFTLVTSGLSCLLFPAPARALNDVPEERGWSGRVGAVLGYSDSESNTLAGNTFIEIGESTIDNLTDSPSSKDAAFASPFGEVSYTFGDQQQLFLGRYVEDWLTLDQPVQLGWRKQMNGGDIFQLSLVSSVIPQELWEDPYLVGTARKKTDRDADGARFVWDRILGTRFEIQVGAREIDVDTERSGSTLGLSAFDEESLRRNGDETTFRVSYRFDLGGGHQLLPSARYQNFDAGGHGEGFEQTRGYLTYSYLGSKYDVMAEVSAGDIEFDDPNPIYGTRQDSDLLSVAAGVFYTLPHDDKRWQLGGNVFWGEIDSDIEFYDFTTFRLTGAIVYSFGRSPDTRKTVR